VIVHAKNDLRRTVEATLNIRVDLLVLKTAAAKVDHFNGTLSWMLQKNVLRFQIAVHNPVVAHQAQGHDHLACESPNQRGGEADETIGLDQLVQIDTEQLHRDTEMIPEIKVLRHFDDMVLLFLVLRNA